MALKNLSLMDFRNAVETKYQFSPVKNQILGKNGKGKTTIREAICFLFCGTDSAGTRNPQHLIREGADALEVIGETDKATISRTLTKRGNSTIKVIKNGVPTTYSQTELERLVGSADLFLSAFVPNYFLDIPVERQHKVISDLSPKIDRYALFAEIAGFPLSEEEKFRYDLARRSDLVASKVADDRRQVERSIAHCEGEIKVFNSVQAIQEPVRSTEAASLPTFKIYQQQWESFHRGRKLVEDAKRGVEDVKEKNRVRASRRAEIQAQLKTLVQTQEPKVESHATEISSFQKQMKPAPALPKMMVITDEPQCPTCGQIVGSKLREKVTQENDAIRARHEDERVAVEKFNEDLRRKISDLQAADQKAFEKLHHARQENLRIQGLESRLKNELSILPDLDAPAIPEMPEEPAEQVSEGDIQKARAQESEYQKAVSAFEYNQKQVEASKKQIGVLKEQVERNDAAVRRLRAIETAVTQIPGKEMEVQAKAFEMQDVLLQIGDSVQIVYRGTPQSLLSTGNRMQAGSLLCQKFTDLMGARGIRMVFIDNADLINPEWSGLRDDMQTFWARVSIHDEVVVQETQKENTHNG